MKTSIITTFILLLSHVLLSQNHLMTIRIKADGGAEKEIKKNGKESAALGDLDFSQTGGKLIIESLSKDDTFMFAFFKKSEDGVNEIQKFSVTEMSFSDASNGKKQKVFPIDKDGNIELASGKKENIKSIGFTVYKAGNKVKEFDPLIKSTKKESQIPKTAPSDIRKTFQSIFEIRNYISDNYKIQNNENIVIQDGVIHIFLDENGIPILTDFPTTARNGDKFQFHIFAPEKYTYEFTGTGVYNPRPIDKEIGEIQSDKNEPTLTERKSQIFGPYIDSFSLKLVRVENGQKEVLLEKTIPLLKTQRVSLNTGVVASFLKNPSNIETFVKPNGDTTLISDNPDVRGQLTLMLNFQLKPRNLDLKPRDWRESIGVCFGTNLTGKIGDNFFLGLNVEVTNGLFVCGGVNFGEVNRVVNHKNFNFGEDKFSGTLKVKKSWEADTFVSVNIDARLFAKAFKSVLGTGTSQ